MVLLNLTREGSSLIQAVSNYTSTTSISTTLNPIIISQELMENRWDFLTEFAFIFILTLLTLPANAFLFFFYLKKVKKYKRLKCSQPDYSSAANSFHTYMIEMCLFDTIIVIYLILDVFIHLLYNFNLTDYESVFDISNFACKFFIYIIRISGAMSNYLVFLLSLNRCLLVFYKYKPVQQDQYRICLNTKYLTLFLFCLCTIANVFRLETLNLNANSTINTSFLNKLKLFENSTTLTEPIKFSSCGPNNEAVSFTIGEKTDGLFWTIFVYISFFSIIPSFGNLLLAAYLIKKRSELVKGLKLLCDFISECKEVQESNEKTDTERVRQYLSSSSLSLKYRCVENFHINEFHVEFLRTCTPCIAFSLAHATLFLPYTIIELINHAHTHMSFMRLLQYMTYLRYMFYCCKFYVLFLISVKFRSDVKRFFNRNGSNLADDDTVKNDMSVGMINSTNNINKLVVKRNTSQNKYLEMNFRYKFLSSSLAFNNLKRYKV
jgi:hypothetical protein